MNLNVLSNLVLENQFMDIVLKERKLLHLVLLHTREVDRRRLYLERAYPSLFEYMTKKLGYSASAAQRRIEASRLLKDIPTLAEKIQRCWVYFVVEKAIIFAVDVYRLYVERTIVTNLCFDFP